MNYLFKYFIYVLFILSKVKNNEGIRCYVCKDCTEVSDDYIQTCGINLTTTTSVPSTTSIDDTTTTEEHEITTDENEEVIVVTTPENVATTTQNIITTVDSIIDSTSYYPIETTSSSAENLVSTTEVTTEATTADDTEVTTEETTEGTSEGTTQETTEGITEEITDRTTLETTERATEETNEEIITGENTASTIQETTDTVTEGTTEGIIEEITERTTYETAETVTEETAQETTASTTEVTEDTEERSAQATSEEEAKPLQEVSSSFEPENSRIRESLVSRDASVLTFGVRKTTNKNNKDNTQRMMVNNLTGNRLQFPVNSRKFRSVISSFRSTLSRDTSEELEPRCIVAYYTENDEAKIVRGCSFESDDAYASCREAIGNGFDGDMSKCKLCDTDLCNSVSAPVVQLSLILFCTVIVTSF